MTQLSRRREDELNRHGGATIGIEELVDLKVRLAADGTTRHLNLDEWEDAYWGRYTLRRKQESWGIERLTKYFRERETDAERVYLTVNVIRPMAEGKRAALSTVPRVRGIPPEVSPEGYDLADKVEKLVNSIWTYSDVDVAFGNQSWFTTVQGSAVLVVLWDEDENRARIVSRTSRGFYCVAKDYDRRTLSKAFFVEEYDGRTADAMYPGHNLAEKDTVEVTEYWGENETVHWVDDEIEVKRVKHNLGYLPIIVVPDIAIPGTIFGDPDVMGLTSLQTELNLRFAYEAHMIRKTINAPMVIVDPINAPKEIPEDEGAVITVAKGGGVSYAPPPKLDYDWFKSKDEISNYMNRVSGTPSSVSGEWGGGTLTGKGLSELLSPYAKQIRLRNTYIHRAWWHATRWAIDMQIKLADPNRPVMMRGRSLGVEKMDDGKYVDRGDWVFEFKPEDFEGWYEFEVYNEEVDYLDAQTRFIVIVQALTNQIISLETARANSFLVRDKSEEGKQVDAEMMKKIQMQVAAEQMAASAMTASPDMNDPQRQQYMMAQGRMGEAPPADLSGGLLSAESAAPGAMPGEAVMPPEQAYGGGGDLQVVADFFRAVDKIKGKVWLAGDILDGMLDDDMIIIVYLTDPNDKATLSNAVKKVVSELHGKLKFEVGPPTQTEPVLEVTPGTQGYEVENQMEDVEGALMSADLSGVPEEELV